MGIDVTYGNVTPERAEAMAAAADNLYPHCEAGEAGSSEPWIANLVAAFLVASDAKHVLETGAFHGHTSIAMAEALAELQHPDGQFLTCEIDMQRAQLVHDLLDNAAVPIDWQVRNEDALSVIRSLPDLWLHLVYLDDAHDTEHVEAEIVALGPKMAVNGIILLHDVFGSCDLQALVARYGGYSIDLPRAGPAGGLGCIQFR